MWDKHWCKGATTRVEGLARRMEPVLEQARAKSILIIHAPSETMSYYANTPGRLLAERAVKVDSPAAIVPMDKEPPLPMDDSDGGCDTPGDKEYRAWQRETPLLEIEPGDVISDNGHEIYNVLRQHGIDTVLMMGVRQYVHPEPQLRHPATDKMGNPLHSGPRSDRCHVQSRVTATCLSRGRNRTSDRAH